jgi:hypothetical protein
MRRMILTCSPARLFRDRRSTDAKNTRGSLPLLSGPWSAAKTNNINAGKAQGLGATEIAKAPGIGRASVYRVLEVDSV